MYSILEINGGIGKSVMATAVCEAIVKAYPERKLIVTTAYPEVFINNPFVYRVFGMNNVAYFYEDYIKDKDVIFLCQEPYREHGYINQEKHLIETWCETIRVKYNGEKPILNLNPREMTFASNKFKSDKPILIFQPFGGSNMATSLQYSWNRDIPPHQAQQIVNILKKTYHIIQPVNGNQIKLNDVEAASLNLRELFGLILCSNAIIGIDSCVQHIAAAFNKPATVCWITNSPKVFGYSIHNNIMPNAKINESVHKISSYLQEHDFSGGRLHDYPFDSIDVFHVNDIVRSYI